MSKLNLIGEKYGLLTVLEEDLEYKIKNNIKGNRRYWKCQCECGNIVTIRTDGLRTGNTKSCGCLSINRGEDLTGRTFGDLTVLERAYDANRNDRHMYWKCKCTCGTIKSFSGSNLLNGTITACGCKNSLNKIIDITGQRFNKLVVLSYAGQAQGRGSLWLCQCDCGNKIIHTRDALVRDSYSSCGCTINSQGVEKISEILKTNNIPFIREKTFNSCRFPDTNALARFDFYVNNDFLIEYDGQQHYSYSEYSYYTKEHFLKTQEHDKYKNNWCKDNHIILKRIPYWYNDKLTFESIMSDKFVIKDE